MENKKPNFKYQITIRFGLDVYGVDHRTWFAELEGNSLIGQGYSPCLAVSNLLERIEWGLSGDNQSHRLEDYSINTTDLLTE